MALPQPLSPPRGTVQAQGAAAEAVEGRGSLGTRQIPGGRAGPQNQAGADRALRLRHQVGSQPRRHQTQEDAQTQVGSGGKPEPPRDSSALVGGHRAGAREEKLILAPGFDLLLLGVGVAASWRGLPRRRSPPRFVCSPFVVFFSPLPRFGSPPQRDPNWSGERPSKPPRHQGADSTTAPPRTFTSRSSAGTGRMPPPRNYPRMGGYKETRPGYRASEGNVPHLPRNGEQTKQEAGYRAKRAEQTPPRAKSPELEAAHGHGSPGKEEITLENRPPSTDAAQPPPDRPVEKKSYSRARRTRAKAGDAGKSVDEAPAAEGLAPVAPKPAQAEASPLPAKNSSWESPVESSMDGLEQELTQMNLAEQSWASGQSQFIQPRELRGKWVSPRGCHLGGATSPSPCCSPPVAVRAELWRSSLGFGGGGDSEGGENAAEWLGWTKHSKKREKFNISV